jgi:hypothetical protein
MERLFKLFSPLFACSSFQVFPLAPTLRTHNLNQQHMDWTYADTAETPLLDLDELLALPLGLPADTHDLLSSNLHLIEFDLDGKPFSPLGTAQQPHQQPGRNIPKRTLAPTSIPTIPPTAAAGADVENIDMETVQEKRLRSAVASAKFRQKKKERERDLERANKVMADRVSALTQRVQELQHENTWLRTMLVTTTTAQTALPSPLISRPNHQQ